MKTSILKLTLLLFCTSLLAQNTWTVDNRPGTAAQFSSIQAAIDAATAGDIIYIHPSPIVYAGFTIVKEIHLRSIGHRPELANGEFASVGYITLSRNIPNNTNASNSSISGLTFPNISDLNEASFTNIRIQNNRINGMDLYQAFNWIVQGNIFLQTGFNVIRFNGTSHGNNLISNNIFNMAGFNAVANGLVASDTFSNNLIISSVVSNNIFFESCNNPVVKNNMFILNSSSTISTINNTASTITFQNCLTFAYGGQTIDALNGTNNINNTNPQFTAIGNPENPIFDYTKNYKLIVGSPAIGASLDGSDLGIYGQAFKFQMKGYPFDLPYPTFISINNPIVGAGSNLQVVLKANANIEN